MFELVNKSYQKGRRRENYVKSKYQELGYMCIRSAGSKSPVDVIALKKGLWCPARMRFCPIIIPIQCKSGSSSVTADERKKIEAWEEVTGLTVKVE